MSDCVSERNARFLAVAALLPFPDNLIGKRRALIWRALLFSLG
jgi:hypothetical protein